MPSFVFACTLALVCNIVPILKDPDTATKESAIPLFPIQRQQHSKRLSHWQPSDKVLGVLTFSPILDQVFHDTVLSHDLACEGCIQERCGIVLIVIAQPSFQQLLIR
jgi:hypothetical protein